ncbi:ATP-binding protein [Alkalilimnicola ehrlichii MLHE-1]|uniref:histidine kinase n=1 Tax=Alkalilimnicola ehrlichii (strain ATCC BAA-1101 / DSM 17681 / MLHE-1) TaxID=187272 RepID=Q0A5C3_ALKEH|nr:ATP-binding protein [Alkalilimnicola ehrlichii]ABI57964.1 multi-sensor signal transduction histidine kinase [Alkalilimnicola ehrlichii MLHE-1]
MARRALNGLRGEGWLRLVLCVVLLASLYLLSVATENTERFGRLYVWLIAVNSIGLVLLLSVIAANLWRLYRQRRRGQVGSRLTVRLVAVFVLLAVVPVSVVYYFSMQFLRAGIDSWFDVRVEHALEDALTLSQASLDLRTRDLLRRVEAAGRELTDTPESLAALTLNDLRQQLRATEVTLLRSSGQIIATSSAEPSATLPHRPEEEILLQLRQGLPYVALDPMDDGELQARVVVPTRGPAGPGDTRFLEAYFPIPSRLGALAEEVQTAYGEYREIAFLRQPLKDSFILTLSLVLLLSLLFAVWTAFFLARRMVAPIRNLAEGTRAVAAGDYGTQLRAGSRDELGFLVESFNDMSRRIARTRDSARRSQAQVERQRAYLETVLGRLSSGVLALDAQGRFRTSNRALEEILGVRLTRYTGGNLQQLATAAPRLAGLAEVVVRHLDSGDTEWREQVTLPAEEGERVLMLSGATLPGHRQSGGHVIVIDDITTLIQAQRDAAWGEVARRLAHEIKNPLTPIQLSAERLRHKLSGRLEGRDAELLERSTGTIVRQVSAMKEMVNAFSEYARPPRLRLERVDLNTLVAEVAELYRGESGLVLEMAPAEGLPAIRADAGRLRQLLHNLIKNAQEAAEGETRVRLETDWEDVPGGRKVRLRVCDNGPGFNAEMLASLFEPYVTTKARGTGLGLPIVKKIVEEHGGSISARNSDGGGACISMRFPLPQEQGALSAPGE